MLAKLGYNGAIFQLTGGSRFGPVVPVSLFILGGRILGFKLHFFLKITAPDAEQLMLLIVVEACVLLLFLCPLITGMQY